MPETKVKIEWDNPEQKHWLNVKNIELALSTYCPNTNFKVTKLGDNRMDDIKKAIVNVEVERADVERNNGVVIKIHPITIANKDFEGEHTHKWKTFSKNKPDENSLIATYPIKSDRIIFDPDDKSQKILFTPFDEKGKLIKGDIEIWIECPTSANKRRLFQISTIHMYHIDEHFFSPSFLRIWQHKYIGVPGDTIQVYFESKKVFEPKKSLLMIKVRAGNCVDSNEDNIESNLQKEYKKGTIEEIRQRLNYGKDKGYSHMMIICDMFKHEYAPVYISNTENINDCISRFKNPYSMTKIMEIYSYSKNLKIQLSEDRAWNK